MNKNSHEESESNTQRLHSYLANCGVSSRRRAEKMILEGKVRVNGEVVKELGVKVSADDVVEANGKKVSLEPKKLFALFKPAGVVTTMNDPQGRRCVGHLVQDLPCRVFPVGRLDEDVTGLLLLTNDGQLTNELLHPCYEVARIYWAVVEGKATQKSIETLLQGVELDDGFGKASKARLLRPNVEVKKLLGFISKNDSVVELVVHVGRKHFVKRILKRVGCPVKKLCRVSFGEYRLGDMNEGEIKEIQIN